MTIDDQLIELGPAGPPPSRRAPLAIALLAVIALVVGVAALGGDSDAEVAVEETTTTTTSPTTAPTRPDPDDGSFPQPIALGGPRDGKESIGLPVKAEPATGLLDGQEVVVTGTGFPPGVDVGVVMCTKEAGGEHGARGVEACNIGRFAQTRSDAEGVATASFRVRRLVVVDGQEVDCASEPQRCLIGMGMISDYDTSGGVLVDFDPSAPLPDPPSATIEGDAPFDDGEEVTIRVDGLAPGTGVGAVVCAEDGMFCADSPIDGVVGSDGSAAFDMRLWRVFAAPAWEPAAAGRDVDCAVVACRLQVWGEAVGGRAIPSLPLAFAAGPVDRSRPVLELRSSGPYRPGDRIEAFIGDVDRGGGAEVLLCGPEVCSGGVLETDWLLGGMQVHLTVPSAQEGNPCLGAPCVLVAHVYSAPSPDAPPPLAPDPVEVAIVE